MNIFTSIDLRDLLACKDVDDSAPLSSSDLRLLIDRLHTRSLQLKSQVHQYLVSHRSDFDDLFAQCSTSASRSGEILDSLGTLLHLLSEHHKDLEIVRTANEISNVARELRDKRRFLGFVKTINELKKWLGSGKEDVKAGRLKLAAEKLNDLKKAIRVFEVEEGEPLLYNMLRSEWLECFEEIQSVIGKLMENAVQFNAEHGRIHVRYRPRVNHVHGVELKEVLEAMEVVGVSDYGLAKAADLIMKHVIVPTVHGDSSTYFVEELGENLDDIIAMNLQIVSSGSEVVISRTDLVYSNIIEILKFIRKNICLEKTPLVQCFGKLSWPRISDLIISCFLSKVAPNDASNLLNFQKIIQQAHEFESALKEMMFISSTDSKDDRLSGFAENIEVHFAQLKKKETLAKARDILLKCDFSLPDENTEQGSTFGDPHLASDQLLLLSKNCVVSPAALQLMKLVHQALQGACSSSARVALEFYHAARDSLLLYEAIVPIKLERQLNRVNQVAVLIHNDCIYLFQEILSLAFQYRADFPEVVRELVHFVDLAPRFQLMAQKMLQKQIQLVISDLQEALDGADGFQNTHIPRQYESARFSMDQVVFIIQKVYILWEPFLHSSPCKRGTCAVLDSVFKRITKDILLLDDIAAEETLQLQRLIFHLLECLSSLLKSLENLQKSGSFDELIPSFRKVRKLADILDMPLKSITSAWESGELTACGFTLEEVVDFIKSTFSDTALRKECLRRIKANDL